MKVDCAKKLGIIALIVLVAEFVSSVYADGYRNPPPTAEGIGKSGVNMVFVDDASAIFYNPANLAHTTNGSAVVSATFAKTETTYNNTSPSAASPHAQTEGKWETLPNLFVSSPVADGTVVLGLGVSTPFGQSIKYNQNELVNLGNFPEVPIYEAQIALLDFNPTVAFRITDKVAVGLGADIFYSWVNFKQYYPWAAVSPLPDQHVEGEGDGYGFGGNAAISWDVTDRQRLAFSYRSEVEVEYDGDITASPNTAPPQLVNDHFDLNIKYPATLGLGYGIALTDAIKLEAMLEWLNWSSSKNLQLDLKNNPSASIPMKWNDTMTAGISAAWTLSDQWTVSAGYTFIESPVPDSTISPALLPDSNRHAISLGVGYGAGGHALDVAYTISIYEDRNSSNPAYPGSYDIDSDLMGVTYSYSF